MDSPTTTTIASSSSIEIIMDGPGRPLTPGDSVPSVEGPPLPWSDTVSHPMPSRSSAPAKRQRVKSDYPSLSARVARLEKRADERDKRDAVRDSRITELERRRNEHDSELKVVHSEIKTIKDRLVSLERRQTLWEDLAARVRAILEEAPRQDAGRSDRALEAARRASILFLREAEALRLLSSGSI
ncbi:hypothetical protein DFJ77DRAFT_478411 [Powellomyces hirtus]|nr:hypothetical protein DFJ77DRAFT_478411 [Powellomyces hirtus]